MKRFLVAEDHSIVRLATTQLLKSLFPVSEVMSVDSFQKGLTAIRKNVLDLLILDINIPGGNHLDMISSIRQIQKKLPILIFSGYDEALYALPFLKAGANGYLSKNATEEEFAAAIEIVCTKKEIYLSEKMKENSLNQLISPKPSSEMLHSLLTRREMEVLDLLMNEMSVSEIAAVLGLHYSTANAYKNSIFEKLNVNSNLELNKLYGK